MKNKESIIVEFKQQVDKLKINKYQYYDEYKEVYSYLCLLFEYIIELIYEERISLSKDEIDNIKNNYKKIDNLVKKYSGINMNWFTVSLHLLVAEELYIKLYNLIYHNFIRNFENK